MNSAQRDAYSLQRAAELIRTGLRANTPTTKKAWDRAAVRLLGLVPDTPRPHTNGAFPVPPSGPDGRLHYLTNEGRALCDSRPTEGIRLESLLLTGTRDAVTCPRCREHYN